MEAALIAAFVAIVGYILTDYSKSQDRSQQAILQNNQNEFNAEQAEINRDFYSEPERFNRMTTDLGWNPNLAAAAIAGSSGNVTQPAQSGAALPQIFGDTALSNLLGGVSDKFFQQALQEAQIKHLNSESRFIDVQSMYVPLSFEETKRVNDVLIEKYKSEGTYFDALGNYYSEMSNWVAPLSAAEASERFAHASNLLAEIELIGEKVNTEKSVQALNASEISVNQSEIKVNNVLAELYGEQKLTQQHITNKEFHNANRALYESVLAAMDVNIRKSWDEWPIPNDTKQVLALAMAYGDDDAKAAAKSIVQHEIELGRAVYDAEINATYENWWKIMANQMTNLPNSVAEGAGFGLGYRFGYFGGKAGNKAPKVKNGKVQKYTPKERVHNGQKQRSFMSNGKEVWYNVYE